MPTPDPTPRMTLCLAVDLKKSTVAGLRLSTKRLDRFNLALIQQLSPHLAAVGLGKAFVKFTGDGWLVISDEPEDAAALCCLAIILACRFQTEIAGEAGLEVDSIPALRLSVCYGRDLPVELPNGQRDFVGDSVRHAVRACQFCHDNEVLVDDTVLRWVHHDFVTSRLLLDARREEFPDAKLEQEMSFHVLEELRPESAEDSDAPEYFVNTLAVIGRAGDAKELAGRVASGLQTDAEGSGADQSELNERFNRLLASNLDYETVNRLLRDMREAGLSPDARTFNNLIAKSGDYDTQSRWLQRMRQEGVPPDARTFTILVKQAANETLVSRWLGRMRKANIAPDAYLLNTLIDRAPDYNAACARLAQMQELGAPANATTYDLLIEKSPDVATGRQWIERMFEAKSRPVNFVPLPVFQRPDGPAADDLLAWFLCQPYHPVEAIWRAIAEYRKAGRIERRPAPMPGLSLHAGRATHFPRPPRTRARDLNPSCKPNPIREWRIRARPGAAHAQPRFGSAPLASTRVFPRLPRPPPRRTGPLSRTNAKHFPDRITAPFQQKQTSA